MPESLQNFISDKWRAGFEIEVFLGSFGDERFTPFEEYEAMDEASPGYCQAVAKELSSFTGLKWSAPRSKPKKPGFYVVPEYDIDPTWLPKGLVAGVELITPPLPLDEADVLRSQLEFAIEALDGWYNFERDDHTIQFGWHINIDAGDGHRLELPLFAVGVDELALLRLSGRAGLKHASPLRHAFGAPLLREMQEIDRPDRISQNLENLIYHFAGRGKSFAANFSRAQYVELRHFGISEFLGDTPLLDLIRPVLAVFQMDHKSQHRLIDVMVKRFLVLGQWQSDHRQRIAYDLEQGKMSFGRYGNIYFDSEKFGEVAWDGVGNAHIRSGDEQIVAAAIHGQRISDLSEFVALMALDVAEARLSGQEQPVVSSSFSEAVDELAARLSAAKLVEPIEVASGYWWASKYDDELPRRRSYGA